MIGLCIFPDLYAGSFLDLAGAYLANMAKADAMLGFRDSNISMRRSHAKLVATASMADLACWPAAAFVMLAPFCMMGSRHSDKTLE